MESKSLSKSFTFKSNVINIAVKTNMPKTQIISYDSASDTYKMNVHAAPEKGEANFEIMKFFRKEFGKDVKIVTGATSKRKVIKFLN